MIDVSKTIQPKSDQLNADDLIAGDKVIEITNVKLNESVDQPLSIYFKGDNNRPWKPCKSMRRVLVYIWGEDGSKYVGKSVKIYRDEKASFGGMAVGGIRIKAMSGLNEQKRLILTASKTKRIEYIVMPLNASEKPSNEPVTQDNGDLLVGAESAAEKGIDAYKQFYSKLTANDKLKLKPYHEALKQKAEAVKGE